MSNEPTTPKPGGEAAEAGRTAAATPTDPTPADRTHAAPPPQSEAAPETASGGPPTVVKRVTDRVMAHPMGKVLAMVLGALLGVGVQAAVSSTGVLGPGIDAVIARQSEGFALLDAKLEALRNAKDPAETTTLIGEIERGVAQQKAYAERTADELRGARTEIQKLKAEALGATGSASGADVWLGPGEGITIGTHGNVFTYIKPTYTNKYDDIYVNIGAGAQRFYLGGKVNFETPEGAWTVVFKQATPRTDGRLGFDIVTPTPASGG